MKLPIKLARRFIAGETIEEAIRAVNRLNQKSIAVTLDLLGENMTDRKTANETVDEYMRLLHCIEDAEVQSTISIKLTMIGLDIDKQTCRENLFRLLDEAKSLGQFVRIDMEGSRYTEQTISLFHEAFQIYGNHVGTVLQASLHRTASDLEELAGMSADIRLCKGAYSEPSEKAIQKMTKIRNAYKEYAKILLEKTPFPRFATHDDELINWIRQYAETRGIPRNRYEFQMLYGLRESTMADLSQEGYCTRVYVPYGSMWFPYFKRRLMERKENIWFVLSNLWKD
ncbi:MAG: proline dehydrogenase family protein [Balneolaceae bacterium]